MITAKCSSKATRATRAEDPTCSNYGRVISNGSVREIPYQLLRRERGAAFDQVVAERFVRPILIQNRKLERQRAQTLNRVADILDWVLQTLDAPAAAPKPVTKRARKAAKAMKLPSQGVVATERLIALQTHFKGN